MSPVYGRVFGLTDAEPAPAALEKIFRGDDDLSTQLRVQGDEQGWYRVSVAWGNWVTEVERFLVSEEGIRTELNTWAAWVEATGEGEEQTWLMQRLIAARQVFVVRGLPAFSDLFHLCRLLAAVTDGVYQIDGKGFFRADGTLLVREDDEGDAGG